MHDQMNKLHFVPAIAPAQNTNLGTTPIVSAIIDRLGYNALTFLIMLGALTDVDAVYAVTMDEGDASDLTGSNAVAAGDIIGTYALAGFTFANDNLLRKIGYRGNRRYVRLTITPTTTAESGNSPISCVAILGEGPIPTVNPPDATS